MGIKVIINSITGQSPFDIYVCQTGGTGCYYMNRIETTSYEFEIPKPYDTSTAYMLKIVDGNNSIISGITYIT